MSDPVEGETTQRGAVRLVVALSGSVARCLVIQPLDRYLWAKGINPSASANDAAHYVLSTGGPYLGLVSASLTHWFAEEWGRKAGEAVSDGVSAACPAYFKRLGDATAMLLGGAVAFASWSIPQTGVDAIASGVVSPETSWIGAMQSMVEQGRQPFLRGFVVKGAATIVHRYMLARSFSYFKRKICGDDEVTPVWEVVCTVAGTAVATVVSHPLTVLHNYAFDRRMSAAEAFLAILKQPGFSGLFGGIDSIATAAAVPLLVFPVSQFVTTWVMRGVHRLLGQLDQSK